MLSIDEAIVMLKFNNKHIADLENDDLQQLAEWLEELKAIKDGGIPIINWKAELELHDKAIRNEAIDDFKSRLEERILAGKMIDEKFAYIDNCDIDEIAEQLKVGGNNEQSIWEDFGEVGRIAK